MRSRKVLFALMLAVGSCSTGRSQPSRVAKETDGIVTILEVHPSHAKLLVNGRSESRVMEFAGLGPCSIQVAGTSECVLSFEKWVGFSDRGIVFRSARTSGSCGLCGCAERVGLDARVVVDCGHVVWDGSLREVCPHLESANSSDNSPR